MFGPLLDFVERLISDFSWRRFVFVVVLAALVAGYESYTASFRLARLDKQVSLLERLAKVPDDIKSDVRLRAINRHLVYELATTARPGKSLPSWVSKGMAALLPWLLLSMGLFANERRSPDVVSTLLRVLLLAIPMVLIGAFLIPTFPGVWVNYVLYPFGSIALLLTLFLVAQHSIRPKQSGGT